MAENNIAVQSAGGFPALMLNGVEATAQQVYDAFMAGPVRLMKNGRAYSPISLYWENSDGTCTNPKAVTYVEVDCVRYDFDDNSTLGSVYSVGTPYVPPVK